MKNKYRKITKEKSKD